MLRRIGYPIRDKRGCLANQVPRILAPRLCQQTPFPTQFAILTKHIKESGSPSQELGPTH
jgi:hypothetical protein